MGSNRTVLYDSFPLYVTHLPCSGLVRVECKRCHLCVTGAGTGLAKTTRSWITLVVDNLRRLLRHLCDEVSDSVTILKSQLVGFPYTQHSWLLSRFHPLRLSVQAKWLLTLTSMASHGDFFLAQVFPFFHGADRVRSFHQSGWDDSFLENGVLNGHLPLLLVLKTQLLV